MIHTLPVLVIAGSVRPNRRSPKIAAWVAAVGRACTPLAFETVDLRAVNLTLEDEPSIPAIGPYVGEATRRWSEKVAGAGAIVFVTPQYNWGYPAALRNAIDHLYGEWRGKPGVIVSYGSQGGGKCAAQLRDVLTGLDMRLAETMPALRLPRERIEANDGEVEPDLDFAGQRTQVEAAFGQLAALCVGGPGD